MQFEGMRIVSDQVTVSEISIILRELRSLLSLNVEGDVVELGCFEGTTSLFLQREIKNTNRTLYVYDSFSGLPEKTEKDQSPAGMQFKSGELLATKAKLISNFKKSNLPIPKIKKAWFSELLSNDLPRQISFAFLDGDYYESIKDSLKLVWPKLSAGAVVIVDDYSNEALPGAAKAVDEWLKTHRAKLKVENSLAVITLV